MEVEIRRVNEFPPAHRWHSGGDSRPSPRDTDASARIPRQWQPGFPSDPGGLATPNLSAQYEDQCRRNYACNADLERSCPATTLPPIRATLDVGDQLLAESVGPRRVGRSRQINWYLVEIEIVEVVLTKSCAERVGRVPQRNLLRTAVALLITIKNTAD